MAAQGYIGRAPGESSVVVARQTFTPTGITTNFTFVSGYTVGYVDAYLNGARLIEGSDYTATDGSVVGLSTNAINGDVLELVAYKAFNVNNVTGANGDFSVPDKIIHANDTDTAIRFPQADTFTVETAGSEVIRIDANGNVGIGTTNTLRVADPKNQSGLNVGFVTANSITAAAGTFGSLNVSGTLTYEDVANQDVVGFATFQKGINVQGAGSTTTTLNVTGVTTMTGDVNIAAAFNIPDAITHVGDTNTKIRFPAVDTFSVETNAAEALRVDSSQRLIVGSTQNVNNDQLQINNAGGSNLGISRFADNTGGPDLFIIKSRNATPGSHTTVADGDVVGQIRFSADDGTNYVEGCRIFAKINGTVGTNSIPTDLIFGSGITGTEKLRIDSSGRLQIGASNNTGTNTKLVVGAGNNINTTAIINTGDVDVNALTLSNWDGSTTTNKLMMHFDSSGIGAFNIGMPAATDAFVIDDGGTERVRIDSSGRALFGSNGSSRTIGGIQGSLQLEGTTFNTSSMSLMNNSSDTNPAFLTFGKSKGGSLGSNTTVANGDYLGLIKFVGADGTDVATEAARIESRVDGTPGSNDMPGRLIFSTTADGASSTTERLRIASSGQIGLGGANYGTAGQAIVSNGSGSAPTWQDVASGITTQAGTASGIVTSMFLTDATDHKVTATGICTITTTQAGTEGESHTIRIVNSGIATVGFSTYFLFPSGSSPVLPTTDGTVSLISFTVHDSVGAGCTQLLAGAALNFS